MGLIEPHYSSKKLGRRPEPVETMLRMYLLQVWFHLSDEAVEDRINDSYAMRRFMGLDFTVAQVPDATTLLHFRDLVEAHRLGEALFDSLNRLFEANGWIMRGGGGCDDHHRSQFDEERHGHQGPGDAPDPQGPAVVLRGASERWPRSFPRIQPSLSMGVPSG